MHKCKDCKYYYETLCSDSKTVFDPLMDAVRTLSVDIMKPCCGYTPGGVTLDPESPHCGSYEKENK